MTIGHSSFTPHPVTLRGLPEMASDFVQCYPTYQGETTGLDAPNSIARRRGHQQLPLRPPGCLSVDTYYSLVTIPGLTQTIVVPANGIARIDTIGTAVTQATCGGCYSALVPRQNSEHAQNHGVSPSRTERPLIANSPCCAA
jgi:hypothetical protein